MRIQLFFVTICFGLFWSVFAESTTEETITNGQSISIEEKIKILRDEIQRLAQLGVILYRLEAKVVKSFQVTSAGLGNLTAIVTATQRRNEQAIQKLFRVELEVRRALGQVDANQNKYEENLNTVAAAINAHLGEIDQLLRQAIIKELVGLDQKAKVIHQQQSHIDSQVGYLHELNDLADRTNIKLNQLECGLTTLNSTQSNSLNSIESTARGIKAATHQIDDKLTALLNNQRNIDKTLETCKHRHHHHSHATVYKSPEHKPEYQQSSYVSKEDDEYLHKLWYGKGQQ